MNEPSGPTLGKLEEVDPGDVWKGEASDFTPWLLDHCAPSADR